MELQFQEGVTFYERLSGHRMVVRYDLRGIGASTRNVTDLSTEAHESDAEAVVNSLKLENYDVFGCAFDAPIALLHAHRNPQRVRRLILWAPYARGDYSPRESTRAIIELCKANWPLATRTLADIIGISVEDDRKKWARLLRDAISPEMAMAYIESRYDVDVSPIVEAIEQPALLLHRRGNAHIPLAVCWDLASKLPNARLIELDGHAEPWIFGHEDYLDNVLTFLDGDLRHKPATSKGVGRSTTFRAVLFTDLVGHTEMMSRLGDERGRAVLREHETITRNVLKQYGGTEVKTMGDGFMASFASVTKAVECAIALQKAIEERNRGVGAQHTPIADHIPDPDDQSTAYDVSQAGRAAPLRAPVQPLSVRVGLNAGEPIEEDGDLFGATVILASRIAAKAEGGEILVADTVRGLCSGKGFLFADRGEFVAKGFEDPVRVYEVRWRE
jgi:class 3 adenylate cyclase/pimeloyl-ACP methyl ester carboxylesterase